MRAHIHQCCHKIMRIRKLSYLVLKPQRQKKAHRRRIPFYEKSCVKKQVSEVMLFRNEVQKIVCTY